MVLDVSTGIAYVMHNCEAWGGDAKRVTVVGQSAGAHLSALALLRQAERRAWRPPPRSYATCSRSLLALRPQLLCPDGIPALRVDKALT